MKLIIDKDFLKEIIKKAEDNIRQEVTICKLNGWNDEEKFLKRLLFWVKRDFSEEALKAFRESTEVVKVGTPCTVVYYSDKRAATVTKVITPHKVEVQFNKVKCVNYYYNGEYEISDELIGDATIFTLRRNGTWIENGMRKKDGVVCVMGYRRHYIDPSF